MDGGAYPEWVDQRLSAELPVLRARGEGQAIEYMERFPDQARELGKEIAAFATSNAGLILLGVSDSGAIVGLENIDTAEARDRLLRRVEGICRGPVKPAITPSLAFAIEDGKTVLAIRVPRGTQPVYYCNNMPYIRHVTESRPAEPHEVIDLIRPASSSAEADSDEEQSEAFAELIPLLIRLLVYGEELGGRELNPWLDELMSIFGGAAAALRELAVSKPFADTAVGDDLEALAQAAETVAHYQHVMGPESWSRFEALVADVVRRAATIKATWIDSQRLAEVTARDSLESLDQSARLARQIMQRAETIIETGRHQELQAELASVGRRVVSLTYVGLDRLDTQLVGRLRAVGHDLHLIEVEQAYMGGAFIQDLLARAARDTNELSSLAADVRAWVEENGLPTSAAR